MTIEELRKAYKAGYQTVVDTHDYHPLPDSIAAAERAGVTAIVRALRDEMDDKGHYEIHLMFNSILGSDAGEKVAGGSTREDEKAVEAAGDKGPVTVNSPATDPCPDCGGRKYLAKHALNGTYYVHCHCPKLKATDPAPAVCVWTRLDPNRVDYRIACAPDPSTIYHPHPQRLASANCANCGKPITFTEANHG